MPPLLSVHGSRAIVTFFLETGSGGDLAHVRLLLTSANGRPALAMHRRTDAGTFAPHGILVFEASGDRIAGLDGFLDPQLLPLFRAGEASARWQ